jgi:large subunit ribosomal protein L6
MKNKDQKSIKTFKEEIVVPNNISFKFENQEIIMKKNNQEIRKKINPLNDIKIEGNKIIVEAKKSMKKNKKLFGSAIAHIKNMILGLNNNWVYKLQLAFVHFPSTIEVDKNNHEIIIKNFLGEKKERRIKFYPEVEVKINKDKIELFSADIEKAGQVAANLEKGTNIKNRDRRVFQDGIYIVEKPGRIYYQ